MDFFYFLKNNKMIILITSFIVNILLIGTLSFFLIRNINIKEENVLVHNNYESNNAEDEKIELFVEIKGAVKKPGVYKLNSDSIINDLIAVSGGFIKSAYTKNINLSKKISNELVVYVYTEKEYNKLKQDSTIYITKEIYKEVPCECSTYDISNCIDNGKSEIIASDKDSVYESNNSEKEEKTNNLVNINKASIEELQTISGIGESKAKDIVNYRNVNGLFKDISEIKNVNGIGNALFEKIKNYITI